MQLLLRPYTRSAALQPPVHAENRGWLAAIKPLYAFSIVVLMGLLLAVQAASAANINLATTINSTPVDGGSAAPGSTVSIRAITSNPGTVAFANVQQRIVITNVSAALYSTLTIVRPTGATVTHSGTTITIVFQSANLPATPDRSEEVSFTVPSLASPVTITATASSTASDPNNTDPNQNNNNGSNNNAQSDITLLAAPTVASFTPASGPLVGGTLVTVTGTNFVNGSTTATVAGTAATNVTVVSATQLTFTTPAHAAGSGTITVTTNGGTATSTGSFTYLAAPTITSFTPTTGPYTGGTLITVTGTGFVNGGTTVTLAGTTVTATIVSATQLTFTTPARAINTTGTIVVTTNGGTDTSDTSYTYVGAATITGNIFEDPNYGGGAGRPLGTTGTANVGVAGDAATAATVELYTSGGAYVATTTTSTTAGSVGQYTFSNLSSGSYIVRVVNSTVRSTRPGAIAGLLPVQTFRTNNGTADVNRVGGEAPELQDGPVYTANTQPVTLTFSGLNTNGDQTVFIDNILLNNGGAFPNSSFEVPDLGTGNGAYAYNPSGASWTFGGAAGSGSGIAANGSAFGPATTSAGDQVAFVQNQGAFQQTTNLAAGTYTMTLLASQRALNGGQIVRATVTINGTTTNLTFTAAVGQVNAGRIAPTSNTAYVTYTTTFTVPVVSNSTNVLSTFTAQSQAPVALAANNTAVTEVNFGYNFSTIVNDNDNGQGSLRQFIINANTLTNTGLAQVGQIAGREVSIFMIPDGAAHSGQRAGLVSSLTGAASASRAFIKLTTALPALTDARTRIDGTTQTANISDSNVGRFGTGGTVGVSGVPLAQINRPEVEIEANTSLAYGLDLEGDSLGVSGIAIHGGAIQAGITTSAVNLQLTGNLIGVTALAIADPGSNIYNPAYGVYIRGAQSYGTVRGNIIGYAGNSGLASSSGASTTNRLLITRNEFVQNGYRQTGGDAISIGDQANAGPITVTFNLITTSNSDGLQFEIGQSGTGGINVVRNNTFFDNGNGSTSLSRAQLEGAAILYLQRDGNRVGTNADSIVFNRIYQTQASGIVIGYGQRNVIISRNSTFGNGTSRNSATGGNLGIDLIPQPGYYVGGPGQGAIDYGNGDGVTANNGTVTTAHGNSGMDYPVFTLTRYNNANNITVTGYVGSATGQTLFANAKIELFLANSLDNNNNGATVVGDGLNVPHGEGQTYITTITADANGAFTANITAPAGITFSTSGQSITATAYLAGYGTSEFSTNSPLAATIVSGYVFEDANYGGGAGRSRTTLGSNAVGRPNAKVEIYDANNAIVGATTTDSDGQYSFNVASGSYTVRTVASSVTSARTNGTSATPAPVAVQTYVRNDVNRVGGENPAALADNPSAATIGALLSFVGQNPSGLDNTAFIDNVEILQDGVPLTLNPAGNQSFETPSVGVSGYQYSPTGASWTFTGSSGIAGNGGSGFNPNTTSGVQVGFIQGDASTIQQTIQLAAGVYSVRFRAAQRVDSRVNNQTVSVRLNGVEIGQITPSSSAYTSFTTSEFSVKGNNQASVPGISQVPLVVGTASVTDVDFGYNFDVITNTNDSGQGSLRQFIANSNALGGEATLAQAYTNAGGVTTALAAGKESSIFMIPGSAAVPGLRAGLTNQLNGSGVAVFTPNTATNGAFIITGDNTVIDGTTQSRNNNSNNSNLGVGGTIGANSTAFNRLNGPEVQIVGTPGTANSTYGLTLSGAGDGVSGISILGFGNSTAANTLNTNGANIYVTGSATSGIAITGNVIGTSATVFPSTGTNPNASAATSPGNGILLASLTAGSTVSGTISNNLIGYNGNSGIQNLASASTNSLVISGNEIRSNGQLSATADGVFLGTAGSTVQANLITANKGSGVDFNGSAGNILVTGNTISNNGTAGGAEQAGVRAYGANNTISLNLVTNNIGDGVLVLPGTNTANTSGSTTLTQNSITTNGRLGINLLNAGESETTSGVTLNDFGDTDGRKNTSSPIGANGLINFPVISQIRVNGANLLVRGYSRPGARVELFAVGTADGTGFGEGATYLASAVEGSTSDSNTQVGVYAGPVNGINQGTDNTNIFVFTIPLSSLPAGFTVTAGTTVVSATATLPSGTSEFSGVVTVTNGPLPVELTAFTATAVNQVDASLVWQTASEKSNDHFEVERSLNGTDYLKIGQVQGQGSKASATDYRLTDAGIGSKVNGVVYYRLKQVDTDGTFAYSPVRSVSFTKALTPSIVLYPNPAASTTTLDLSQLPSGSYEVSVLDATGRVVVHAMREAGLAQVLDLSTIANGTYLVRVQGSAISLTHRLVKE